MTGKGKKMDPWRERGPSLLSKSFNLGLFQAKISSASLVVVLGGGRGVKEWETWAGFLSAVWGSQSQVIWREVLKISEMTVSILEVDSGSEILE